MSAPRRRRWVGLGALGGVVLALHGVALLVLGPAWLDPDGAPVTATVARLQVRSVVALPANLPAPSVDQASVATPVRPLPRGAAAASAAAVPAAQERRAAAASVPAAPEAPGVDAVPQGIDVPVYATLLPPAGRWIYRLQRGMVVGEAELEWAPTRDAGYALRLQGRVAGVNLLDWASQGQIDAAGIAPERFAVRRRGRDSQAANFQRGPGKITFSGPTHELPLLPGAQDRLSWMLQLPAIVAAAPQGFAPGASIRVFVAGARGGGDVWDFVVQGLDAVGATPALKLVREPQRLYDTRAEIWLDPADHFLPLRILQTPTGGGAGMELLREAQPGVCHPCP